jgi:glycosyltransferase involved in cell wall biosynthesis
MVYWASLGSHPATVLLKYLGQALRTWWILATERPAAVFVMTPPLFAPLVAWSYCALFRCRLVVDAHSAAFLHPRWKHLQWLQFWLMRRAATTIVHNEHFRQIVERHGGHATIVGDIPIRFQEGERYALPEGFNIAVVSSFNPDEPIAAVVEAARRLPDVHFHLSGDAKALDRRIRQALPPNVRLTGFLPDSAYGFLISRADAVMALTTRDHTMLRGAWEAVYQDTPVIVSNWPILHKAFDEGAIHVDNSPEDIVLAVTTLRSAPEHYREGARRLRRRKEDHWKHTLEALRARIQP